ncbi:MAG: alpha-L-glutamate ligase [Rickettsiaceae bacterium]|jgi:ribosomal protein S6--L-glutamate ligase|nr:alpha-L-glutamate ligase [Rickettsiaceae bacterium]
MKIILLASNPQLYSNRRIMQAAGEAGHNISFVNIRDCYININANKPEVYYKDGKKFEDIDAVIPRIKPAITFYATTIVRQFEMMNVCCLNKSLAITSSRDKLNTLQLLSREDLPMPITSFSHSVNETKQLIEMVGGVPLVVKLLEGTKGVGVVLAETNKAAQSVINAFKSLKADILVQEYIKESKGRDIRCFVIGDRVVAAMERQAEDGEFRANMHLGGKASTIEITDEERAIAIRAVKTIGLEVAGVDMVRSNFGPKILEINSSPGLEGIETVTGINIAGEIIKFLESLVLKSSQSN